MGEGLGEVEGVDANLPDVVPPADVEGRGGRLPRDACDDVRKLKEMSRMRALQSVMQSSQVPEVTALQYSLPTCVMRA